MIWQPVTVNWHCAVIALQHLARRPIASLYLHSHLKHRWANETDAPTRVLWVNAALPVKAGVPAPVTDAQDGEIPREPFSAVVGK